VHAFGREPVAVTQAPGRVNLIGEHTDYNDGYVMPTPIPLMCSVAVGLGGREHEVVAAALGERWPCGVEAVVAGDAANAGVRAGSWASYVFGVMHEVQAVLAARGAGALPAVQLAIASDVPIGSGLSSSAALEVAVARALLEEEVWGGAAPALDPLEVAQLCQRAEHRFAGVPCGIMDQLASAAGVPGVASVIDCRTLQTRHVPLPDHRIARFLVIDSGVRHANASGEYAARRRSCEAAARELGVNELRDADAYMLEHARAALPPEVYRCALHVVNENPRVLMAAEAMRGGDMERLGGLMNLSHASLRDLYRVSCPEVDRLVEALQSTEGVKGARMTGAGFGGCVVALVPAGHENAALQAAARIIGLQVSALWLGSQ